MRLVSLHLTNFRSYSGRTEIRIDPLTIVVGRNDAGKSSLLDALNVFFNDEALDKDDKCARTSSTEIKIGCVFEDVPTSIVIDNQHPTSLDAEYLLRQDGRLEIIKTYNCAGAKGKQVTAVVAFANHPSADGRSDLLALKLPELKARARTLNVDLSGANEAIKADIRKAIWQQCGGLNLATTEVPLLKESGREVWDQLQLSLPVYALFKSDRPSTDQDSEAQDPMKAAIKEAIRARESDLEGVIGDIKQELERVAARTVAKIAEMNPELAGALSPQIKNKNWDSLFSVSLTGDDDIPLNKRGSGTRRLVLLNFFRARAEETSDTKGAGVIYAIEEPETSQHPNHQIMLLEAFEQLVSVGRCQIILTTHTPTLARRVDRAALRMVEPSTGQSPIIRNGENAGVPELIARTLGVLPDHDVKVFFGVEGKHDVLFLRCLSKVLAAAEPDIPDLEVEEQAGRLVFMSLGGGNLELWLATLASLNRPEFYLTDRDSPPPAPPKYETAIAAWQARGCSAWATSKRELENYLHLDAIREVAANYSGAGTDFEDVSLLFAEAVHCSDPAAQPWAQLSEEKRQEKCGRAKRRLNTEVVRRMNPLRLTQSDSQGELRGWLRAIGEKLRS